MRLTPSAHQVRLYASGRTPTVTCTFNKPPPTPLYYASEQHDVWHSYMSHEWVDHQPRAHQMSQLRVRLHHRGGLQVHAASAAAPCTRVAGDAAPRDEGAAVVPALAATPQTCGDRTALLDAFAVVFPPRRTPRGKERIDHLHRAMSHFITEEAAPVARPADAANRATRMTRLSSARQQLVASRMWDAGFAQDFYARALPALKVEVMLDERRLARALACAVHILNTKGRPDLGLRLFDRSLSEQTTDAAVRANTLAAATCFPSLSMSLLLLGRGRALRRLCSAARCDPVAVHPDLLRARIWESCLLHADAAAAWHLEPPGAAARRERAFVALPLLDRSRTSANLDGTSATVLRACRVLQRHGLADVDLPRVEDGRAGIADAGLLCVYVAAFLEHRVVGGGERAAAAGAAAAREVLTEFADAPPERMSAPGCEAAVRQPTWEAVAALMRRLRLHDSAELKVAARATSSRGWWVARSGGERACDLPVSERLALRVEPGEWLHRSVVDLDVWAAQYEHFHVVCATACLRAPTVVSRLLTRVRRSGAAAGVVVPFSTVSVLRELARCPNASGGVRAAASDFLGLARRTLLQKGSVRVLTAVEEALLAQKTGDGGHRSLGAKRPDAAAVATGLSQLIGATAAGCVGVVSESAAVHANVARAPATVAAAFTPDEAPAGGAGLPKDVAEWWAPVPSVCYLSGEAAAAETFAGLPDTLPDGVVLDGAQRARYEILPPAKRLAVRLAVHRDSSLTEMLNRELLEGLYKRFCTPQSRTTTTFFSAADYHRVPTANMWKNTLLWPPGTDES